MGYFLIAGMLIAIAVAFVTLGIRQKRKAMLRSGLVALILGILVFFAQLPEIVTANRNNLFEVSPRRTEVEIFEDIFDEKPSDAITILNAEDRIVPSIDYAAVLHFTTSADKMKSLLEAQNPQCITLANENLSTRAKDYVSWFQPQLLGEFHLGLLALRFTRKQDHPLPQ